MFVQSYLIFELSFTLGRILEHWQKHLHLYRKNTHESHNDEQTAK